MESTFRNGNAIAINELGQTASHIFGTGYMPKRGDVVVFRRHFDKNNPINLESSEMVIKRVLGLPGERIVINAGIITIYNKSHPDGFQPDSNANWRKSARLSAETDTDRSSSIDVTLKAGQIFVVGDNRSISVDSRSFGPISVNDVIGNVFYKL